MIQSLTLSLACCGRVHVVQCDPEAVARGEPNERKKNLTCSGCGTLVILTFRNEDAELSVAEQEIINFPVRR